MALLQAALIDLGYRLPKSTAKTGLPDGIFGDETAAAVARFQAKQSLRQDGIAGRKTLTRIDTLLLAALVPPVKPPPVLPPPPSNRDYQVGTADPTLFHDPGAGTWNSIPKTVTARVQRELILEILPPRGTSAHLLVGDDAARHMKHYLDNSGSPLTIDLEGMIEDVGTARRRFENEVNQAKLFVESLSIGKHSITSVKPEGGYNSRVESNNWYFAIGGYSSWGKGEAQVTSAPSGREYELRFEYRFYDRYNWDAGKSVELAGITIKDAFMGEFHRQGLAQEYDCVGAVQRVFRWKHGQPIPAQQYLPSGGR